MSEPFLAEVKIVGFTFPPRGWAFCDGQILPIAQNQSLYSLLGTIYGGDGRTSFALPDLRGRTPVHWGGIYNQGNKGGEETHALSVGEIPAHRHGSQGSSDATISSEPAGNVLASTGGGRRAITPYGDDTTLVGLNAASVSNSGQGQGHENMQPFRALNFCIALTGLFPSRN